MAQYYESKEISKMLEQQLKICKWDNINDGESFEIELPVVLYFNYQRLKVYITPIDDGYYITDDGQTFIEYSLDTQYYFNLFNKMDTNYHYDIELKNEHIYKEYRFDYSLISAIDEFIRFFIYLDEFIRKNDIT
jgi:hypothetical protein